MNKAEERWRKSTPNGLFATIKTKAGEAIIPDINSQIYEYPPTHANTSNKRSNRRI